MSYNHIKELEGKYENLLQYSDGQICFIIVFDGDDFLVSASFTVYEITSWSGLDNSPIEIEEYISGYVKWDGCSNITFGNGDGTLHLCGRHFYDLHKKVMDAIWDKCSKKITNFDNEIAS
jgi:hypothetical protein